MFWYFEILSHKTILFCILLSFSFFVTSNNSCYSLIEITYSDFGYTLGSEGEPTLSCELTATLNGNPLVLTTDNTRIIQSKAAFITNITIEPPKPDGKQTVTWGLEIALPHNVEFEAIVTSAQEIGSVALPGLPEFNGYNFAIFDLDLNQKSTIIQQRDFTDNNQQFVYFRCASFLGMPDVIPSRPYIDSITFSSPNFSFDCWAYKPAARPIPFPAQVLYDNWYRLEINYNEPAGHPYMREWMIVHFGGGIKYRFELFAHEFEIPNRPQLKLLYPNGGENFAPCEEVLIQWEGHHPNYHTRLDFSNDSGQTWRLIEIVPGDSSSYLWTVPENISDNCFINIRQTGTAPTSSSFGYDEGKIHSAVFDEINNNIASKILTTSSMNNIVEWDISTFPISNINTIHTEDSTIISCAVYTDKDKFVVLDSRNKELLFYNSGNNTLQNNVKLTNFPDTYKPFTMQCDPKRRFILIEPEKEYGNTILFTDINGNYITTITEYTAFTDIYISEIEDKLYYSLIDNTIKAVSLANFPTFSNEEEFDFAKEYSIVNALSVSNDGNMIGITTRKPDVAGKISNSMQQTDNIIFDKRIGQVYKNLKVNVSSGLDLCFSPASSIAIVASPEPSQVIAYDLTNSERITWPLISVGAFYGITMSKTGNSIVGRSEGNGNTNLITFVMPEFDRNDTTFAITRPNLTFAEPSLMQLNNLLIGTTDTTLLEMQLCNTGLSKIEITQAHFTESTIFELEQNIMKYPLVLMPGECTTIHIIAHPNDTGLITRNLVFTDICDYDYEIPISIYSINRSFNLVKDTVDFGTVCLFDTITFTNIALFTNEDSIDVVINSIASNSPYFIVEAYSKDTVLKPGESYTASLKFIPGSSNGDYISTFTVFYENQRNVTFSIPTKAVVIVADIATSHNALPFIPEEPTRTITFTNNTEAEIVIDSITISPTGTYNFNADLPKTLQQGESFEVIVTCLTPDNIQYATLLLHSSPCSDLQGRIPLVPYSGTATLEIPDLQANPTENDFVIPVNFTQTENFPYNGIRPFEATIAFNAMLFYPKSITSTYGTPEIISNNVAGNLRIITLRLNGSFINHAGELLQLHGITMLGNTAYTDIAWHNSKFYSTAVTVTAKNGSLQLIELCEDRLVSIEQPATLKLNSIAPLPAKNIITVNYQIETSAEPAANCLLEMYSLAGTPILQKSINSSAGKHSEPLDITNLASGNYLLTLRYGKQTVSLMLLKAD